jgi:hypothetical protein
VKGELVGTGRKYRCLYKLDACTRRIPSKQANVAVPKRSWDTWHRLYGHIGISGLETLKKKGMVDGLEIDETSEPSQTCEACIQAKQTVQPFPKEASD